MDCRFNFNKFLSVWTFSLGILSFLSNSTAANEFPIQTNVNVLQFDSIIELNAPLCRTHVVLFARYWVSPEFYKIAVIWAEPHAGSLNFPLYPPTINVTSDTDSFKIDHQFLHMYDGVSRRPIGQRGPFLHKFNSYYFSDIRFAEQDALDMHINTSDIGQLKTGIYEVNLSGGGSEQKPAQVRIRSTEERLDGLSLFDSEGKLLKKIEYEYKEQNDERQLNRQIVLLPERLIIVGFKGKKPTITIGGEKRQYSQLETTHHQGGRKCIVDNQTIEIGGVKKTLPCHITVYSGDGNRVLRSAKLYNFTQSQNNTSQLKIDAEQFSHFDKNEIKCREMLLKYWLKDPSEVEQADVKTLKRLFDHLAETSTKGMIVGEHLRRMNMMLQLDWMLGHTTQLESNFREYLSLLIGNDLKRMILVGGQNAIEMTSRWGQFDTADKLLEIWLDVAVVQNNVETVLNFAADSIRKKDLWTTAKLMEKVIEKSSLSIAQRFVAQAVRCLCLERLSEMLDNPDRIKNELDAAQAGWVSYQRSVESIRKSSRQGIIEAKQLFTIVDRPNREQKVLMTQLNKLQPLGIR